MSVPWPPTPSDIRYQEPGDTFLASDWPIPTILASDWSQLGAMQETLGEGADLTPGVMDNESMDTRDESAEIASWEKFDSNGLVVSKRMDILPSHLQIAPQLTRGGDQCVPQPPLSPGVTPRAQDIVTFLEMRRLGLKLARTASLLSRGMSDSCQSRGQGLVSTSGH